MNTSLRAAEFVDSDLSPSIDELISSKRALAYAITENQGKLLGKVVDSDPDPYSMLTRVPQTGRDNGMQDVVSLCLVMTGWMTKVNDDDDDTDEDTDEYDEPERIRVRVISAVSDSGVSCVVTRYDNDGGKESFSDGGEGAFPEALKVWWETCKSAVTA